jgi:anti-sigma-K factor RskA
MDYGHPRLVDALASQYVAGTLRGRARKRFEALLAGHPALRAAVHEWQERLMPLTGAVAPEPPPRAVWQRIEHQLWPNTAPEHWWQRLALWRGVSAFATVAALSLALLLALPQPAQPPVVVVLQGTGGASQGVNTFVASVSADGRALVTRPLLPVALEANRVLELWSVPPQGAPKSLGLISASGVTVLQRDRLLKGAAALAVSLEPPGGSPTGAPTGPVLYAGTL